jgi:RNA polymerase sigma-B factor
MSLAPHHHAPRPRPAPPRQEPDPAAPRNPRAVRTAALLEQRAETDDPEQRRRIEDEVILLNRDVALSLAHRFARRGIAIEDLRQTALVGLTKAVRRFDPSQGDDLVGYAVPTIRGELQRLFRDSSWAVRPPRRLQELHLHVRQAADELTQRLGHSPTAQELSRHLDRDLDDVLEALAAGESFTAVSLDQAVEGPAATLADTLGSDDQDDQALVEQRLTVVPALARLSPRDRRILYLRFFENRTQAEIGQAIGVSQMQVSRLLARILSDLRRAVSDDPVGTPDEAGALSRDRISPVPDRA